MPERRPTTVAIISSYVPRRCGIASFTHDLATALARHVHHQPLQDGGRVQIVAMNDGETEYNYGPEVIVTLHQHRRQDYRNAADVINNSRAQVVSLQHEYGLFGGREGDYLFELLDRLHKPLVSTLHTVLAEPTQERRNVLRRIGLRSSAVVVMAERARALLDQVYDVPPDRIRLIHHGVPDLPFGDTEPFKERFGLCNQPIILTFGLLSPGKGIDMMLDALARVVPDHPDLAYIVLGVTHPGVRRESGELYRISLERRAVELGIQNNVLFHNRYVSAEDLCEFLQAADLYVTPYRSKEQITSGTLAYALASGRAIISTPYWHAQELLADGRGRLVDFGDVQALAATVRELLNDPNRREAIRRAAHAYGRRMIWPRVAQDYAEVFTDVRCVPAEAAPALAVGRKSIMRMSLLDLHLDHFFVMTDDTGMLQHARYATPNRHHGYATDDNARAVIVGAMIWSQLHDERILPRLQVYLSFLHDALDTETGRFRNFLSYDRRWLDHDGSDDGQGRVLWALGYLISHAPNDPMERLATDLFRAALAQLASLKGPRSWALAILGLHYALRQAKDQASLRGLLAGLADRLDQHFVGNEAPDWHWCEDLVTYDNGRLPQALITAGLTLDRTDMVERGLRVLRWLLDVQTAEAGHLSIIGNKGWYVRGKERPVYDQQPLEPAALIAACKAAYRASGGDQWLVEMRRCFEWYLGRNDHGISMIDFKTYGCHDGLQADGINQNQGAEAILSWLLSLLIMHEMQTGDAPEVTPATPAPPSRPA
ncbi:MAG TPA: glycosyltransferase family 4 protein [Phycisphaerae bacterium]|nr:glycosyltransferase family 4 protein [Phycisphaerae bacterium]